MEGVTMSCHVFLTENVLAIQAPYYMKDVCKSIPGARWKPDLKMWTYPATPSAAQAIHLTLPQSETSWAETAAVLLVEADRMAKAQAHKTAADLPAIPWKSKKHWHFQLQAFHFAKDLNAFMLAADMGCGKGRIAIDLVMHKDCQRVLVICPKSVIEVWPEEFAKHGIRPVGCLPLNDGTMVVRAKRMQTFLDLQRAKAQPAVVIINYDAVWRVGMAEALLRTSWDMVICDESHRIKSTSGKSSRFCSQIGDRSRNRMCLTGTPFPHDPLDGFAQYRFLDKGIFGTSFTAHRARYAEPCGYMGKQTRFEKKADFSGATRIEGMLNQDEFYQKFYSIAFRVESKDVQDLPETLDIKRPVILSSYARSLYNTLKQEFVVGVADGTVTASNALTRLLRLQQIGSGWARFSSPLPVTQLSIQFSSGISGMSDWR